MANEIVQRCEAVGVLPSVFATGNVFRRRHRYGWFWVLLVGTLPVIAVAQVKKPPVDPCDAREMMRLTYEGDLVKALAKSEACIAFYEKEALSKDGDEFGTSIVPPNLNIGFYMCAKIQLLTMINATSDAEHALFRLELFADSHPAFRTFGVEGPWDALLNLTRGMVLEKEGKIAQARDAYRQCECSGRLALLALVEKDDAQAEGWARLGAVYDDPSAVSVLGALAEAAGYSAEAYGAYSDAERKMKQMTSEGNNFKPASLSERHRVHEGLLRVGKPDAPRVVESAGKRRFYGEDKKVAGWDRWPHILYSSDVKNKQDEYDTWLQSFRPGPTSVALRPQYPRFFVGFAPDERSKLIDEGIALPPGKGFGIPARIEPTGVLDLDTLAIPFYKGVVEVSELAKAIGLRLDELQTLNVAGAASGHDAKQSAEILELKRAVDALEELHGLLKKKTMTTSAGMTFNASGEARQYATFNKAVEGKAIDFDTPPDFVTAHFDAQLLTPEFIESLVTREAEVRIHIRAARQMVHP